MSDIEFPDGLLAKAPSDNAPDFVKCKLSIKRKELIAWLESKTGEWINLDVNVAKSGNWYAAVNTWKRNDASGEAAPAPSNESNTFDDDIPF